MRYTKIILLLFVTSLTSISFAQYKLGTKDKKAIESFELAQKQYRSGEWENALQSYDAAISRDSNFTEAYYEKALLYAELKNYNTAIENLQKVISLNEEEFPEANYYCGLFYLNKGKYVEAKTSLTRFLEFPERDLKKTENAKRMLQKCEFALRNVNQVVDFKPINMGPFINTEHREYFPCLTADNEMLLYTRLVPSNQNLNGAQEDFYVSINSDEGWRQSTNIGPPINTLNNEGAPTLSVDGFLLIFTACVELGDYGPGRNGYGSCDLFFTQKIGNMWTKPRNLGPTVNTRDWETQPALASDGRTLYFVRGRKSGYTITDADIYSTYLTDTGWTVPVKLPPEINSDDNEESVFIHPDNRTMYFSSRGHPGYGGLDIFMSQKDEAGNWSKAVNLGYPINTENHENSLMVNAKGEIGYFGSNRPGGYGDLDLYYFEMPEDKKPDKVTFMKGKVFDARTKDPLLAKFELIDLKTGETIIESYSNGGNGQFLVCLPPGKDYALNASKDGYLFYSDNFTLTAEASTDEPFIKNVPMMAIREGSKTVLNNIFFETNKYDLKPASKVELNKLLSFLNDNASVQVEIGGHTDNTGSKALNIELSKNRAKSVHDYLVEKGIDPARLSYKGYADEEPVASNDSASGRAKNRRTEFKITGLNP